MKRNIIGIIISVLCVITALSAGEITEKNQDMLINPNNFSSASSGDWIEKQKLLASDGGALDYFGASIAIDGDTALIGAWDENVGRGAAYVFIRTEGILWEEQAKLTASDGQISDLFGSSVALFGDTALIGVPNSDDAGPMSGSAYVFIRSGTTWSQQQKLLASDGAAIDSFGDTVALGQDTALIGAYGNGGAAYIFTRSGESWTQKIKLTAPGGTIENNYGCSVSLDGDIALVGDTHQNGNETHTGAVFVYRKTGTTWTQQAKLITTDGQMDDGFGHSLSLSGDSALIGASGDDDNGESSGSAYIFIRNGITWTQQQKLLPSDGEPNDKFSWDSVSLDGDTALIGVMNDDDYGTDSGSAYIFVRNGTTWTQQQKLHGKDTTTNDNFGGAVAISGNTALIGAYLDDDQSENSGSTYLFTKMSTPLLDLIHLKGGLLSLSVELKNFGDGIAENISWQMNATGGYFFYPKIKNGTLNPLAPGETQTIQLRPVFGLGTTIITFLWKYRIQNFSYDVDFYGKQEWRNRAFLFLNLFPQSIQPTKDWMMVTNYTYINTTMFDGIEFRYLNINNMHNVRIVVSTSFSNEVAFQAACKFTSGTATLYECWLTKPLLEEGNAHWEVELVDGG